MSKGVQRVGNFWPKAIFDNKFKQEFHNQDLQTYYHMGTPSAGVLLPVDIPIVSGVIEVATTSSTKVSNGTELLVARSRMSKFYKHIAKNTKT